MKKVIVMGSFIFVTMGLVSAPYTAEVMLG